MEDNEQTLCGLEQVRRLANEFLQLLGERFGHRSKIPARVSANITYYTIQQRTVLILMNKRVRSVRGDHGIIVIGFLERLLVVLQSLGVVLRMRVQ